MFEESYFWDSQTQLGDNYSLDTLMSENEAITSTPNEGKRIHGIGFHKNDFNAFEDDLRFMYL